MDLTRDVLGFAGWLALTLAAAWVGARFLPDAWYRKLNKPGWNPPDRLFAPVWSTLYLLMAAAAWLVWRAHGFAGAGTALAFYVAQLALNAAWTWLFFGRRRIGLALAEIGVLWVVILLTLIQFAGLAPLAAWLLAPYLAWVSFAALLNASIWRLNRPG